jgi:glycosyltransferase involved in cell wall biosynthesis
MAFGGGWRKQEWTIRYLDRTKFTPYVFYNMNEPNPRLSDVEKLGCNLVPYNASGTGAPGSGYEPKETNFNEIIKTTPIDIIHFARSGYYEWPFVSRLAKLQIETNIFGFKDSSGYLDRSIVLTNYLKNRRGFADAIIPNPIPDPDLSCGDLRKSLGISDDTFVLGRIGDPADLNFAPIALQAYGRLCKRYDVCFLIFAPSKQISRYKYKNIFTVPFSTSDLLINQFYNTIDLFLHYRKLGETFCTTIAQAMSYGVPSVSHTVPERHNNYYASNGHVETMGDTGFVASNVDEYQGHVEQLINDRNLLLELGLKAYEKWQNEYRASVVAKKIEQCYLDWL